MKRRGLKLSWIDWVKKHYYYHRALRLFMSILLVIFGFLFLLKGGDFLVDAASALAKRFKVSDLMIGLTIVAFGTSAPELVVNIVSVAEGSSEIAIGNILGSNIANILLILGVAALIYPLKVSQGTVWKEIPFSLLAAIVLAVMASDTLIDGGELSQLSRIDGIVFLSFFIIFMYYAFSIAKNGVPLTEGEPHRYTLSKCLAFMVFGLVGLIAGGKMVVEGAVEIARLIGMSESFIGLTVVAIGTSLPELAASAIAAKKGKADIAVGNVVGSNIFNVFLVLGVSSTIRPLPFLEKDLFDIAMVLVASLFLFLAMFVGSRHQLYRFEGVFFLLLYASYLGYLVVLG